MRARSLVLVILVAAGCSTHHQSSAESGRTHAKQACAAQRQAQTDADEGQAAKLAQRADADDQRWAALAKAFSHYRSWATNGHRSTLDNLREGTALLLTVTQTCKQSFPEMYPAQSP